MASARATSRLLANSFRNRYPVTSFRGLATSTTKFQPITVSANFINNQKRLVTSVRGYSGEAGRNISGEITKLVGEDKVVIFMKGVPDAPRCGFSNAVVQIMRMHDVKFEAHNVLEDEELRQGVKDFSNWPTIPQVYFNGEFIGGCDILLQMHQSGELVEELEKIGIKSALLTTEEEKK